METGYLTIPGMANGTLVKFEGGKQQVNMLNLTGGPNNSELRLQLSYKVFRVVRECLERYPIAPAAACSAMDPLMYELTQSVQELTAVLRESNQPLSDMLNKVVGVVGIWYGKLCHYMHHVRQPEQWEKKQTEELLFYGAQLSTNGYLQEMTELLAAIKACPISNELRNAGVSEEGQEKLAQSKEVLRTKIVSILEGIQELSKTNEGISWLIEAPL